MTDYDRAVQKTAHLQSEYPDYHDIAIRVLAKAYEILTMLDHVDSGDWLGESIFAGELDKMAHELGYKSAMDIPVDDDPNGRRFEDW